MSEVSLCIIRIEVCCQIESDNAENVPSHKAASSYLSVRGLRTVNDIYIETYTPSDFVDKMNCHGDEAGAVSLKHAKDTVSFVSGNPFVEVTKGIIHLFKENDLTDIKNASLRSQTVCILAVPAIMSCSDLLAFTAACHTDLKYVRIVKGPISNQYMALLTFRTPQAAEQFYKSFNGIPFNSLEPDCCCHVVFVSKVESLCETEMAAMAPASHTELPLCPVCLERMDESVDGILTIMCNHSFHSNCLEKWGDTSCPVCRYVQTPEPTDESSCLVCKATESLWICLICGHIGCGRYLHGHAYQHYVDTHHCYSMQIGSNRVWDYVGDNFVHRLVQNEADGKLVEGSSVEKVEKMNSQQLEFTYLLTSQLESQRQYYEELMNSQESTFRDDISVLREKIDLLQKDNHELRKLLDSASKEKNSWEKKHQNISSKLNQTQKDLKEEKVINEGMQKNMLSWQKKVSDLKIEFERCKMTKEKELSDIKEQLRDVMFFLEAKEAISNRSDKEEIEQGHIEIGKPETSSKNHRRKKYK